MGNEAAFDTTPLISSLQHDHCQVLPCGKMHMVFCFIMTKVIFVYILGELELSREGLSAIWLPCLVLMLSHNSEVEDDMSA